MEPTIPLYSFLTIDFDAYKKVSPKRFDLVIFELNVTKEKRVYRVIGLPNETIEVQDGFVVVNGEKIKNPTSTKYFQGKVDAFTPKAYNKVILKSDEFYVLADKETALDSRYIGPIKRSQLMGKVTNIEEPK